MLSLKNSGYKDVEICVRFSLDSMFFAKTFVLLSVLKLFALTESRHLEKVKIIRNKNQLHLFPRLVTDWIFTFRMIARLYGGKRRPSTRFTRDRLKIAITMALEICRVSR